MKRFRIPIVLFFLLAIGAYIAIEPTGTFAGFTKSQNSLNSGLIGYWTFDGKDVSWATGRVTDMSGGGNTGTIQNISTSTGAVQGKLGQAFNFLGSSNYVQIINNIGVTGSKSISFWIKPNNGTNDRFIFNASDGTNNDFFVVELFLDRVYAIVDNITSSINKRSSVTLTMGQWYHVVVTKTTGNIEKIYLNGVDLTEASGDFVNAGVASTMLGARPGFIGTADYNGVLDDVRLYNRVLSQNEVTQLYKMGGNKVGLSPKPISTNPLNRGLIGYYTFDGKDMSWATGRVTDMSGNGNVGTLQSLATSSNSVTGKVGQGIKTIPTTGRVIVPSGLNGLSTFTACAWIKFDALSSYPQIFSTYIAGDASGWDLYLTQYSTTHYRLESSLQTNSGYALTTTYANEGGDIGWIIMGKWQFVCVTQNGSLGSNIKLYIDGGDYTYLPNAVDAGTRLSDAGNGFVIGGRPDAQYGFNGGVDDVRIYNRVLSNAEIIELYHLGQPKTGTSPTQSANPLNSGIIGYWTFDGKDTNWATGRISDAIGTAGHLTIQNMATSTNSVQGKIGQGIYFDGSNDYLKVSPGTINGLSVFTACAWVKPTNSTIFNPMIISTFDAGGTAGWDFHLYNTGSGWGIGTEFWTGVGGYTRAENTSTLIKNNQWAFFCAQQNGDALANVKLFLNATEVSADTTLSGGTRVSDAGNGALIGWDAGLTSDMNFIGTIDDVRVYNRILTATEIAQLYGLGRGTIK